MGRKPDILLGRNGQVDADTCDMTVEMMGDEMGDLECDGSMLTMTMSF